jgi:prepilin peptidase CpaA
MAWSASMVWAPLIGALAVAAVIDARQRRIPNWLTFGLLGAGLCRAAFFGAAAFEHSVLGFLAGGAFPLLLYALSAVGAGDVKLLAAIGAWVGPGPAIAIFMVQAILGLIIVVTQAIAQRRTGALLRNSALIVAHFGYVGEFGLRNAVETGKSSRSISRPLPFAVPVFIATLIVITTGTFLGR